MDGYPFIHRTHIYLHLITLGVFYIPRTKSFFSECARGWEDHFDVFLRQQFHNPEASYINHTDQPPFAFENPATFAEMTSIYFWVDQHNTIHQFNRIESSFICLWL